eukprot:240625-Pelagomonas_calceolata.AAC.1
MNPAYQEALNHLNHLESACAKSPNRLNHLCGKSARTVVEDLAADVVNLLHECHNTALNVCSTKTKTPNNTHFKPRQVNKRR